MCLEFYLGHVHCKYYFDICCNSTTCKLYVQFYSVQMCTDGNGKLPPT